MAKKSERRSATTSATQALRRFGVDFRLHSYDFDPGDLGIGEQAATALGIEPARLFKTLVVMIDDQRPAIALTPVAAQTRMKALASALGGKRAAMIALPDAERLTGYVKGGISPFGQRQRLDVVVDQSVQDHDMVFVNGGRRGLQIELSPDDLITTLNASLADLAR
ncbi:MAG: Cys-tRNA(Pro) deacylase [Alphaproteobacteria bacterium]|nr:Cys-tRNA(Pro) deacylase [Alphaproteobacteria bacterium]